jgi:uroporphyrin-III C-methyltransferase
MKASGVHGKVYFLGAGPGDPELLTRKAWKLLSQAEVVLHDALVPPEILRLASPGAILCPVGKRCGQKSITQEQIHSLLIEHARAGRMVVRLQGGDPLIFGRAGEEIAALQHAQVDFEIVPGVTAASAAAAAAQISLTDRRLASKLIFLSAHRGTIEPHAGWESLPSSDATLAIYMPGRNHEKIARELAAAGWRMDTPCVIVSQAGTAQQLILRMDLAGLAVAQEVPAPTILLVGAVTEAQALEAAAAYPASAVTAEKEVAR